MLSFNERECDVERMHGLGFEENKYTRGLKMFFDGERRENEREERVYFLKNTQIRFRQGSIEENRQQSERLKQRRVLRQIMNNNEHHYVENHAD